MTNLTAIKGDITTAKVDAIVNAAFDAGFASALGKSIITLHNPDLAHALKEVDGAANAVCETPEQVVAILEYVMPQS